MSVPKLCTWSIGVGTRRQAVLQAAITNTASDMFSAQSESYAACNVPCLLIYFSSHLARVQTPCQWSAWNVKWLCTPAIEQSNEERHRWRETRTLNMVPVIKQTHGHGRFRKTCITPGGAKCGEEFVNRKCWEQSASLGKKQKMWAMNDI